MPRRLATGVPRTRVHTPCPWVGEAVALHLDDAAPDDLVMERDGQRVLVDPVSLPFLQNAVIDFTEELIGARFVIDNPDASSSCGCGTSFSF